MNFPTQYAFNTLDNGNERTQLRNKPPKLVYSTSLNSSVSNIGLTTTLRLYSKTRRNKSVLIQEIECLHFSLLQTILEMEVDYTKSVSETYKTVLLARLKSGNALDTQIL
jgi:hypothetical protein